MGPKPINSPMFHTPYLVLITGRGILIRTHDGPKVCIPLCLDTTVYLVLITMFPLNRLSRSWYMIYLSGSHTIPYHTILIRTHDGPKRPCIPLWFTRHIFGSDYYYMFPRTSMTVILIIWICRGKTGKISSRENRKNRNVNNVKTNPEGLVSCISYFPLFFFLKSSPLET